jgi:hypothetical protein
MLSDSGELIITVIYQYEAVWTNYLILSFLDQECLEEETKLLDSITTCTCPSYASPAFACISMLCCAILYYYSCNFLHKNDRYGHKVAATFIIRRRKG